jgi:hypothetical protein
VVARVTVEEGEQDAANRRVDDLVDAWESVKGSFGQCLLRSA